MSVDLSSITESLGVVDGGSGSVAPMLYGRTSEKLVLLKAYQRVVQTEKSQFVFVHGASGSGKTSLVDSLRELVTASRGYFCAGKFFQNSAVQEPYSAIMASISDLCDLVVQSEDFNDDERRHDIEQSLSGDFHLLSRAINLSPLIGPTSTWPTDNSDDRNTGRASFARFGAACKMLLRCLSSSAHPVVLFIDDIQWMDEGSKRLIEMLVGDDELTHALLIFSYRDEEAPVVDGIIQSCHKDEFIDLHLADLNLSSVHMMVCGRFGSSCSELHELSTFVLARTGGNPLFVTMFLQASERKDLVNLDGGSPKFDLKHIKQKISTTDSLAELVSQRVHRLPEKVRVVLAIASLIGYYFDGRILSQVAGVDISDVSPQSNMQSMSSTEVSMDCLQSWMSLAVDARIVEVNKAGYQFTHDKLQGAFEAELGKADKTYLHLHIGEVYLAQQTVEKSFIYNAAVHLNLAPCFLQKAGQRIELARINLRASQYCLEKVAFAKAADLLRKGLMLLEDAGEKWSDELFDLTFDMTESLARVALLVGDFSACKEAISDAMDHATSVDRKMSVLLVGVECRFANNEMKLSVDAAVDALAEVGFHFPRRCTLRQVVIKVAKVNIMMSTKTDDGILALPLIEDRTISFAVTLLSHISTYSILLNDGNTGITAGLLAVEMTLKHGVAPSSATAFAVFGLVLLRCKRFERAHKTGRLALKMAERSASRDTDVPTIGFVNTFLRHWKDSLRQLQKHLFDAARAGFERGNVAHSGFCFAQCSSMALILGDNVETLLSSLQAPYNRLNTLGQQEQLIWIRPILQTCGNLRSHSTNWEQLTCLSGEFMNEEDVVEEAEAVGNAAAKALRYLMKAVLSCHFGFYIQAMRHCASISLLARAFRLKYTEPVVYWMEALSSFEQHQQTGKRKFLRRTRICKKLLERVGGPNVFPFLKSIELKGLSATKQRRNDADLLRDFDLGILELDEAKNGYLRYMANRDAGRAAMAMGRIADAKIYFEKALDICERDWGATSVCQWMMQKRTPSPVQELPSKSVGAANFVGSVIEFG